MPKEKKESRVINLSVAAEVYNNLEQFCEETGLTKTKAVEKILSQYFTDYFRRSPKDRNLFS